MEKQPNHDISHSGSSLETASPDVEIDSKREKALLRKIDLHLMVPLWIIFVFGFLDRINLGNVAVLGILKELKMDGNDMALAMQIFFVPYIAADIPSNIILKRFAPSTWISVLTFCWGEHSLLGTLV
jgi:sugar phosphate permease